MLTTKWMRGIIAAILKKIIKKKLGYDVDVRLTELKIINEKDTAHVALSVEADIPREDMDRIIKEMLARI